MFDAMNLAILVAAGGARAPLLLVFLAFSLLAGDDGPLGIEFDSGPVAYFIGTLALAIILFDSGSRPASRTSAPPAPRRWCWRRSAFC